jgi:di/tricarboxylate transporter
VGLLAALIATRIPVDVLFVAALTVLLVAGVVTPAEGLAGFANEGVLTVAVLYVVVSGVRETGGVQRISRALLGRPRHLVGAQLRLTLPVAFFSAFLNNTPVVAMMIPAVRDWAKAHDLPVAKLMIPLSYAAMLGGMGTLVGTSATLVAHGLLIQHRGTGMGFFEIAWVGVPVAVAGLAFMLATSRWLLPSHEPDKPTFGDPREYTSSCTATGRCTSWPRPSSGCTRAIASCSPARSTRSWTSSADTASRPPRTRCSSSTRPAPNAS